MNAYLAQQFSGAAIQAVIDGLQQAHDAYLPMIDAWADLSIATASGVDGTLDFIGCLAGYPRPIVPATFSSPNVFTLSQAALYPQYSILTGLGSVLFPGNGGLLTSVFAAASSTISDAWFRVLIPLAAQIKYYGLTIYTVDLVASFTGVAYTIGFHGGTGPDIDLTFNTDIGYQKFWILEQIFDKYSTTVQVNVVNGPSSIYIAITQGIGVHETEGLATRFAFSGDGVSASEAVTFMTDLAKSTSQGVTASDAPTLAMTMLRESAGDGVPVHEYVSVIV